MYIREQERVDQSQKPQKLNYPNQIFLPPKIGIFWLKNHPKIQQRGFCPIYSHRKVQLRDFFNHNFS